MTTPEIDQAVRDALYRVLAGITGRWDGPRFYTAAATEQQILAQFEALRDRIRTLEGQVHEGDPSLRSQLADMTLRAVNAESKIPGGRTYERERDLRDRAEAAVIALAEARERIEDLENYGTVILRRAPNLREVMDHADRFPVEANGRHGGWWELLQGDGCIFVELLAPWNPEDPADARVGMQRVDSWTLLDKSYGVTRAIPLKTNPSEG